MAKCARFIYSESFKTTLLRISFSWNKELVIDEKEGLLSKIWNMRYWLKT